jgi:hypothetical protein
VHAAFTNVGRLVLPFHGDFDQCATVRLFPGLFFPERPRRNELKS